MKKFSLLLTFFMACLLAQAQLTLEECLQKSLNNYPLIKQNNLIEQSNSYTLSNLAHSWLPQLTVGGQATWQSPVPSFPDQMRDMLAASGIKMNGIAHDQYRVQVDLSQKIYDGGLIAAEKRKSQAFEQEQVAQNDVDMYGVKKRVIDLFFGILLLEQQVTQTQATIDMLEGNHDKLMSHVRNGAATTADADLLEAEVLTAKQNKTNMEWACKSFKHLLEIFINEKIGDRKLVRPQETEEFSPTSNRPELKLIDAKIKSLNSDRDIINGSLRPTLSAFAQAYYGYPGYNTFESMLNHKWTFNTLVGLKITWSPSALYNRSNKLNKLDITRRQLEVQRETFLFNNRLEASQENDEILRLREIIKNDERITQLRKQVRIAEESKLRNGVIDIHMLVEKITAENVAAQNKIIHGIELLKTGYDLKNTLNQ